MQHPTQSGLFCADALKGAVHSITQRDANARSSSATAEAAHRQRVLLCAQVATALYIQSVCATPEQPLTCAHTQQSAADIMSAARSAAASAHAPQGAAACLELAQWLQGHLEEEARAHELRERGVLDFEDAQSWDGDGWGNEEDEGDAWADVNAASAAAGSDAASREAAQTQAQSETDIPKAQAASGQANEEQAAAGGQDTRAAQDARRTADVSRAQRGAAAVSLAEAAGQGAGQGDVQSSA